MPLLKKPRRRSRLPKREESRRLSGLGLGRHDDPDVQREALAIVERFLVWVRQQPCAVSRRRRGERFALAGGGEWQVVVEAAHVIGKRGGFTGDFLCVLPLTDWEHRRRPGCQEHNAEYFEERGLNEQELAWRCTVDYLASHVEDCRWLAANVNDGTLSKLCADVLEGTAGVAVTHRSEASDKDSSAS